MFSVKKLVRPFVLKKFVLNNFRVKKFRVKNMVPILERVQTSVQNLHYF